MRAPPPTRRVSARERARVGSIFSNLPRALPRVTRPTQVKGTTKKPTHSPLRACCVHSIRDGRRVESRRLSFLAPRARAGEHFRHATRVGGRLVFFVSSRRPVGVSPRADDSVARECVRDHSFVLTTCVYVNSVSTFARRPSYRRRQMVVCSTPLTEALAVALEFPKPSRRLVDEKEPARPARSRHDSASTILGPATTSMSPYARFCSRSTNPCVFKTKTW